jgi:pantothenate kinase
MITDPPWPDEWTLLMDELTGVITLTVAGYRTDVELTPDALERVHFPLLAELVPKTESGHRVLAGLAGIPGAGKSTFAAAMEHVAGRVLGPRVLLAVGVDGWHWPQAELDRRTTRGPGGEPIALHERKGGPDSFDVASLVEALDTLARADGEVRLPVYDRTLHEPVPDELLVGPETRIVIVEGDYVLSDVSLMDDEPGWDEVSHRLSPKWFLECGPTIARARVVGRHIRGGLSPDQASAKYEVNDGPNTMTVLATADRAERRIRLGQKPGVAAGDDTG